MIQTVLVHTLPGVSESGCSLAPGIKNVTDKAYWEFVDEAVELAEEMGIYLGLLPSWGSLVKDGILNRDNITEYAEFLESVIREKQSDLDPGQRCERGCRAGGLSPGGRDLEAL